MEEKILFERFLFGDGNEISIDDMEFCVDRIVILPKIRPHQLEKAVRLSVEYCKLAEFRRILLDKTEECPVLIYQLHKRCVFDFNEIQPYISDSYSFLLSYYFRKEIDDFESFIESKYKPDDFDESLFENTNHIDQQIEYGFLPSSIEYCLKYDVIDEFDVFDNLNGEAKWSPFEWSEKPEYLDYLSFTGFFGSIKCFKYLLFQGFKINDRVLSMVVCGGCLDLFHLCQCKPLFVTPKLACQASQFSQMSLLVFMIENGVDINANNYKVQFLYLMIL